MSQPDKLVYFEVGDPDYKDGLVTTEMVDQTAEVISNMGADDVGVLPWYVTARALPLSEPADEIPVVPYTVEEEELKEKFDQADE